MGADSTPACLRHRRELVTSSSGPVAESPEAMVKRRGTTGCPELAKRRCGLAYPVLGQQPLRGSDPTPGSPRKVVSLAVGAIAARDRQCRRPQLEAKPLAAPGKSPALHLSLISARSSDQCAFLMRELHAQPENLTFTPK
jgi:hypothetical protein